MAAITAATMAGGAVLGGLAASQAGGKGPTQTTRTEHTIPDWLQDASKQAVGVGQDMAGQAYDPVAAENAMGLTDIGRSGLLDAQTFQSSYQPYLDQATNMLGASDRSFLDADLQQYMNPYVSTVLDNASEGMSESYQRQINNRNAEAVSSGAFGGLRATMGNQVANNQYLDAIGDMYESGMAGAYQSAANRFTQDRAYQNQLAQQYAGLADLSASLRGQQIGNKLTAGGIKRAIETGLYNEGKNWMEEEQLAPLLASLQVPHSYTGSSTGTVTTPKAGWGDILQGAAGGAMAGMGMYGNFAGMMGGGGGAGGRYSNLMAMMGQ